MNLFYILGCLMGIPPWGILGLGGVIVQGTGVLLLLIQVFASYSEYKEFKRRF